ncbi:MAG: sulfotransferase [Marinoscillum sp.]
MNTWWKQYLTSPIINTIGQYKERRHFSKPPILIGGCGRSGTSLLLSILSAHPNIHAIPVETDAFTNWDQSGKPLRKDRFYRELIKQRIKPSANRWCEKRPYNVRFIPEILNYFDQARFIHLVRDPRAVCTSIHPINAGAYWIPIDRYVQDVTMGLEFVEHPQVLTIRFEDLLAREQITLKKILDYLDEPLSPEIENWVDHATVRIHNAWAQKIQPLDPNVLDKWQEEKHQKRVQDLLKDKRVIDIMKIFNYE